MYRITALLFSALLLAACGQNANPPVQSINPQSVPKGERVPYQGSYSWQFKLGPYLQTSHFEFKQDAIDYGMDGKVYSTAYSMKLIQFDQSQNKWTGVDDKQNYYAIFFKDQPSGNLLVYKKKFPKNLQAALDFKTPAADDTDNHGWNLYVIKGKKVAPSSDEPAPLVGVYQNPQDKIEFKDGQIVYRGKSYQTLSHHPGERRIIGSVDAGSAPEFILVFYDDVHGKNATLTIEVGSDGEKLYRQKHQRGSVFSQPQ